MNVSNAGTAGYGHTTHDMYDNYGWGYGDRGTGGHCHKGGYGYGDHCGSGYDRSIGYGSGYGLCQGASSGHGYGCPSKDN